MNLESRIGKLESAIKPDFDSMYDLTLLTDTELVALHDWSSMDAEAKVKAPLPEIVEAALERVRR